MIITLKNIYYKQNEEVIEYKDIYLETSMGVLRLYVSGLGVENNANLELMDRLTEIDDLKEKYGNLNIDEIRRTYDNDIYLLLSGKFILAIEYILNSSFNHSIQEFRIIEDVNGQNKKELENFKEMDLLELPVF